MVSHQSPIGRADEEAALHWVLRKLGITDARERAWEAHQSEIRPDFVYEHQGKIYILDLKGARATVRDLANLVFLREYFDRQHNRRPDVVLAARSFTGVTEEVASEMDVRLVDLPPSLMPAGKPSRETAGQITTPAAWRVTFALLKAGSSSIRQLSKKSGVSYGWTHRTVKTLDALSVATQEGNVVRLKDQAKLFNGVAWERPFRKLQAFEVKTDFASVEEGARELTRLLARTDGSFGFTAHTAAGFYTGYGFRADRFHLYADPATVEGLVQEGDGPVLHVYNADRVLDDFETLEDVRLASPAQVLLDLAGMGPGAKDMMNAMVAHVARP